MDCWKSKKRRVQLPLLKKAEMLMSDSDSDYSLTPSPPPAGCWARLCRPKGRQPTKVLKKVSSNLSDFSNRSDVTLPPLPVTKKASSPDQLRRDPSSQSILAQLQAENIIPGARDLHRADLRVTARATATRGGLQWEVEDPTRAVSPAPTARRARSRAARPASRAEYSAEGGAFLREQLAAKHARSEQLRRELDAERTERLRARRQRDTESRERAKAIKKEKERQPYREMEPAEREEYLQMIDQAPQPKINLPPLAAQQQRSGNKNMWWHIQTTSKYM